MSLWESDAVGLNRDNPTMDNHGLITPGQRMSHGTGGITLVVAGSTDVARVVIRDGRISTYKSDGTLLSVTGIRSSDGDAAVEIAKPGQSL